MTCDARDARKAELHNPSLYKENMFFVLLVLLLSQTHVLGTFFSGRNKNAINLFAAKSEEVIDQKQRSDAALKKGIAKFYDEVSLYHSQLSFMESSQQSLFFLQK